jgi:hypothetical protein
MTPNVAIHDPIAWGRQAPYAVGQTEYLGGPVVAAPGGANQAGRCETDRPVLAMGEIPRLEFPPARAVTTRSAGTGISIERMLPHLRATLAMTHQTGVLLAEIGFLLILFAGVWIAAAQVPRLKHTKSRTLVAGIALALGGLLLIIATSSGPFG